MKSIGQCLSSPHVHYQVVSPLFVGVIHESCVQEQSENAYFCQGPTPPLLLQSAKTIKCLIILDQEMVANHSQN